MENLILVEECDEENKPANICRFKGCTKRSNFNIEGSVRGKYCKSHKKPGMIDVNNKRCRTDGCKFHPVYNFEGQKPALYCLDHKEPLMVNIINKKCVHPKCNKYATFNVRTTKTPEYCSKHKSDVMINVKATLCDHPGCDVIPHFNYANQKKGKYCSAHKKDNMVNVVNKTCAHDDCPTLPSFNYKGLAQLYCTAHKLPGMVDVKGKKICEYEGCTKQANFNTEGIKGGKYCFAHKDPNMVNVISKQCKTYLCGTLIKEHKYEGYCIKCFARIYPDRPNSRNYKTKETAAVAHIKTHFPDFDWILDKRVLDGCSHRRPDAIMDLGYQLIIVEVDENQHSSYDCSCENKRLMEISKDVGHRPIIFIRFNPDKYLIGSVKVKSCWGLDGHGMCVVKDKTEWNKRLDMLNQQIRYWTENSTHKTLEIIELFYDLEK